MSVNGRGFSVVRIWRVPEYCLGWSDRHSRGAWKRSRLLLTNRKKAFGADHSWVSVDTNDRPVYKFGDAKRKQPLVQGQSEGHVTHLHVHSPGNGRSACTVVCQVTRCVWEQSSTSRRVMRSFAIWNLKPRYSWNAVPRDICGWICSNKCQCSVIIPCRC